MFFTYFIPRGIFLRIPDWSVSHHALKIMRLQQAPLLVCPNSALCNSSSSSTKTNRDRTKGCLSLQELLLGTRVIALPQCS